MTKGKHYSFTRFSPTVSYAKAKLTNQPVRFKTAVETANALRGMSVDRAIKYLNNVITKKECVPFKKFNGGVGRCAQAKQFNTTQGRWPVKAAKALIGLIQNAIRNAEFSGLDCDNLQIVGIQVNPAATKHRRTYRAHGIINPYMSHYCHAEIVICPPEK